jgi:hypothetical protein
MAMKESFSKESSANNKKPYEKPSFRYEQVFVTTALSCGKATITQSNCASQPTKS